MNTTDIGATLARHRACFQSGKTRPAEWREQQLAALRAMVTERADDFAKALWSDLRRNRVDAVVADIRQSPTKPPMRAARCAAG